MFFLSFQEDTHGRTRGHHPFFYWPHLGPSGLPGTLHADQNVVPPVPGIVDGGREVRDLPPVQEVTNHSRGHGHPLDRLQNDQARVGIDRCALTVGGLLRCGLEKRKKEKGKGKEKEKAGHDHTAEEESLRETRPR